MRRGCDSSADCKEVVVVAPFASQPGAAGPGGTACLPTNAPNDTVTGEARSRLNACIKQPNPQCFVELQFVLAQTGCVNCLPFIQQTEERIAQYCSDYTEQMTCEAATTPCPSTEAILGVFSYLVSNLSST